MVATVGIISRYSLKIEVQFRNLPSNSYIQCTSVTMLSLVINVFLLFEGFLLIHTSLGNQGPPKVGTVKTVKECLYLMLIKVQCCTIWLLIFAMSKFLWIS